MAAPSPFLAKANSVFSLDLFKTLSKRDKTENIFYSPFSISSALAMVLLGARGKTAKEISKVLGFSEGDHQEESRQPMLQQERHPAQIGCLPICWSRNTARLQRSGSRELSPQSDAPTADVTAKEVHTMFGELLCELNKADGPYAPYALSVASKLYGEQTFHFLKKFLADLKKRYRAELESVDFKNNAEGARVKINTWMEEKTGGKIKDLLTRDNLDTETKLVLVNAIYFKAEWAKPFKTHQTVSYPFRLNKKTTKPVKMMCQENFFSFCSIPEVNIKVLEMPYENRVLSMIFLLPDSIKDDTTGLEQLETALTHHNFMKWTEPDSMKHGTVVVKIPQFKLAKTYDLEVILQEMGMSDAFTVMSDLSGMSSDKDLVLSKVIHKTFVEVDERGTVAAALTAGFAAKGLYPKSPHSFTFIADHPFLFFIRHNPSKSILFSGRFCSPE